MLNSLDDIEIMEKQKILGEGAFSQVLKVFHKKDKKTYALKKINLTTVSSDDTENLKREIKLHKTLSHKNIIKFHDALQIKNMVYLLLEHAQNGCLFFYINSKKGLPESLALKFFFQIAKSINHLHSQNIVHRDIKPENILLDINFNAKLCDFGWACYIDKKNFRTSVCGTYEYMSPEIVKNGRHTSKVDIWCLGIMLYEMLHGEPPFSASNMEEMKNEFRGKKIMISSALSREVKGLLRGLLRMDFRKRLDIGDILKMEIFDGFRSGDQRISRQDYEVMMKNYLENVRSNKRNLPKAVSDYLDGKKRKKKNLKKKSDSKKNSGLKKKKIKRKKESEDKINFFGSSKVDLDFNKFGEVDFFNDEKTKSEKKKKKIKYYYVPNNFKVSNKKNGLFENKTMNDLDDKNFEKKYQSSKNIILTTSQNFDNKSYLNQKLNNDNEDSFNKKLKSNQNNFHNFENNLYQKNESSIKIPSLIFDKINIIKNSNKKNIEKETKTKYNFYKNNEYYQDSSKMNESANFFNINSKSEKNIKLDTNIAENENRSNLLNSNSKNNKQDTDFKNLNFINQNSKAQSNLKLITNLKNLNKEINFTNIITKSEKNINNDFNNFDKSSNFFNLQTKSEKNIKTYNQLKNFNQTNFFDTNKEEILSNQKYKKNNSQAKFKNLTPKSKKNIKIDKNLIYHHNDINTNLNFGNNDKNLIYKKNKLINKNLNFGDKKIFGKNKKKDYNLKFVNNEYMVKNNFSNSDFQNKKNFQFDKYINKNLNFDNNLYEKSSNLQNNQYKNKNFQNQDNTIKNFIKNEFIDKKENFEKKENLKKNEKIISEKSEVSFYKNNRNKESYSSLTFVNADFDKVSKNDMNSEYDFGSIKNPSFTKGNLNKKNGKKFGKNLNDFNYETNSLNNNKSNFQNYSIVNINNNLKKNLNDNFDTDLENKNILNFGNRKNSEYRLVNKIKIQKPLTQRGKHVNQNRNSLNLFEKRNSFQANFKYVCENGVLKKIPLEKNLNMNEYNNYASKKKIEQINNSFSLENKFSSLNFNNKKTSIDKKISKKLFKTESKSPLRIKKKNLLKK